MSKDLFLMMREQEVNSVNFLPTKKEIQTNAKTFITNVLESGEIDKLELLSQSKRMKEALEIIDAEITKALPDENFEAFGLKGTFRSVGNTVNYMEDEIYATIYKDLQERKAQLDLAQKQDTFDAYGNQVPKVSTTPRKSSLAISF